MQTYAMMANIHLRNGEAYQGLILNADPTYRGSAFITWKYRLGDSNLLMSKHRDEIARVSLCRPVPLRRSKATRYRLTR